MSKVLVLPIPDSIFLQWYGTEDKNPDPFDGAVDLADVSWHTQKVFESDIEYVIKSTLTTTQAEVARLREALKWSLDFIDQVVDKSPAEFYDPVHPMLEGVRFVLETGRAVLGGVDQ